ncbi:VAC14, partial [Symbiodinium sp. CCMP2456]
ELLPYIPTIFDGISRLFADVNTEVRHAATVLDKLLRDIVTSAAAHGKDQLSKFPAETFVQQLGQRMRFKNPNIRQLCLGWTTMILGINGMDAVRYTPIFINEVFDMLADADDRRDSRHNADNLLDLLLTQ